MADGWDLTIFTFLVFLPFCFGRKCLDKTMLTGRLQTEDLWTASHVSTYVSHDEKRNWCVLKDDL